MRNSGTDDIFNRVFMYSIGLLCITDKEGLLVKLNPEWQKTLGYEISDMEGKPYLNFVHPDDIGKTIKIFNDLWNNDEVKNFTNRYRHKNGTFRWLEWRSFQYEEKIYASALDISERKEKEKQPIKSHKFITDLQRITNIGSWEIDLSNNSVYWSDSLYNIYGLDKEDFTISQASFLKIVIPEDRNFVVSRIEELIKLGITNKSKYRIILPDGRVRNMLSSAEVLMDGEGKPSRILGVVQDITESQLVKGALIESEEKARLFIENTPLPIAMFDANMCYINASKRWSVVYGLGDQELTGRSAYEEFSKIPDRLKDDHQRVLKGEIYKNDADKFIREDGTVQWLRYELHPWYKADWEVGGLVMFTEDITERKNNEEKLLKNQTMLNNSQRIANLGSWEFDLINMKLIWNEQTYRIHGMNDFSRKVSYDEFLNFTHPEDREKMQNHRAETIRTLEFKDIEYRIVRSDNEIRAIRIAGEVILNDEGNPIRFIGICQDITEQKESEKQIILAKEKAQESDKLKTAFLANLSHEIRTPMNGILGFAELLKVKNISETTKDKYINVIEQSGQRMLRLIADLVDISKIEANQVEITPQETNLNQLFDKIYNFFKIQADSKKVFLSHKKELPVSESNVLVDNLKLEQILTNLINNAIKFTKAGSIHFSYSFSDDKLIFKVKDTGIGIPTEMKEVIFERFRQAENTHLKGTEGTGLGLSISKAFIELMGGEIWVDSVSGKGSEFTFCLPYKPVEEKVVEKQNHLEGLFKRGMTILVAEDDDMSYLYLEQLLSMNKCKLLYAENGKQAIHYLKEHPEINLILMDLKMPIMNGIDATIEIRKKNKKIPIIAQTAYVSEADQITALKAGCNEFITKPIKKEDLFEKLEFLINKEF